MEDIIFSGSDARRPTATAEVRLQLSHVTAALVALERERRAKLARSNDSSGDGGNGNGHRQDTEVVAEATGGVETIDSLALTGGHAFAGDDLDPESDETPTIARDVEVGRRLYRSGESEYLIDGRGSHRPI